MRKWRWNKRKFANNMLVLLAVLGMNVIVFWMLFRTVLLGGAV